MRTAVCGFFISVLYVGICLGAEIFVPANYPTIQAAVNAAIDGDIVILADGVYLGSGNRDIRIEKSVTVRSAHGAKKCVIDCKGSQADPAGGFILGTAGVYSPEKQIVLEGLTIQGGYTVFGGGVYVIGNCQARIEACRFVNNTAYSPISTNPRGAALENVMPKALGGAVCCKEGARLVNCIIEGCWAEKGGAIYCGPKTTILHCTITGNQANEGGAIFYEVKEDLDWESLKTQLVNSVLWDNRAEYGGQLAMGNPTLIRRRLLGEQTGEQAVDMPLPPGQQGMIYPTGRELDLAIDGPDFFVLDGAEDTVFTRIGNFSTNEEGYLIDPETGRYVRRWGTVGEEQGFQKPEDLRLKLIPANQTLPGRPTTLISFNGNLRASSKPEDATVNCIRSKQAFSIDGKTYGLETVYITELDQFSGSMAGQAGYFHISGLLRNGTPFDTAIPISEQTVVQDVLDSLTTLFADTTATIDWDGCFRLKDDSLGYSRVWIDRFEYMSSELGNDRLETGDGFEYLSVGGEDSLWTRMTVYSQNSEQYLLKGVFVKSTENCTWDFVVTDVKDYSGQMVAQPVHARIWELHFNTNGSYGGLTDPHGAWVGLKYPDGNGSVQRIDLDFGKPGDFFGLTQFASVSSTAGALTQDGYKSGSINSLTFDNRGTLVYTFSNGIKVDAGQIATAVFLLPSYLAMIEQDCYRDNNVSGMAQIGRVQGSIVNRSLENRIMSVERRAVPFVVNQCVIQEGLKGVSFGDPRGLKAMDWKTVYTQDPFFCRAGRWISSKEELTWSSGDYRPLPGSICIDRGLLMENLPTRDITGNVRPFEFCERPLINISPILGSSENIGFHDLGAREVWRQQPESVVRIYPNTIMDKNSPGNTLLRGMVLVTIQIKKEFSEPSVRGAKDVMLFAQPNMLNNKCPLAAKRTFVLPGKPGWINVTGMFDYETFCGMLRYRAPMNISQTVDEQKMVFWLVLDDGAYLKATGQVKFMQSELKEELRDQTLNIVKMKKNVSD